MNEKRTIEDILIDMKDRSELMIDLAYSSLLYDNRQIAEEVYELEDYIDSLHHTVKREVLEEVHNKKMDIEDALMILRMASSSEVIADAAREIADVELRDVDLHPILKESIKESDTVFTRVRTSSKSVLCGKTLGNLKLASETGMTVIAIRRRKKWIYGPRSNTKILSGDILFARGPADGEKHLLALASGKTKQL